MNIVEVGERIKTLREAKHLNRNQLATLAGVSPTYIYQLEKGEKSPTIEYLGYICFALNISLKEFFDIKKDLISLDKLSQLTIEQKSLLNSFLNSLK